MRPEVYGYGPLRPLQDEAPVLFVETPLRAAGREEHWRQRSHWTFKSYCG
jgi:hypothetical protein